MKKCPVCTNNHDKKGLCCSRSCANKHGNATLADRICAIPTCGKEFKPAGKSSKYCSEKHSKECITCGDTFTVRSRAWEEKQLCNKCSRSQAAARGSETLMARYGVDNALKLDAAKEKSRQTNLKKYGVEHYTQTDEYREKVRQTNLEKYNVEHTFQRKDVKTKIVETTLERYGVDHALKNDEFKAKQRLTNMERYGVENVAQNEEVKAKIRATNIERYGSPVSLHGTEAAAKTLETWDKRYGGHPLKSSEIKEKIQQVLLERYGAASAFGSEEIRLRGQETMLERYGVAFALQDQDFLDKQMQTTQARILSGDINPQRISKINKAMSEVIQRKFTCTVELEHKVATSSFDLLINEDILVELNPTVTHNNKLAFGCLKNNCESGCEKHTPTARDYHYKRALLARENGYRLIQIYDWDTEDKIMALLSGKLATGFTKHSSRKLTTARIKQKEANVFLNESHIQGGTKAQSHCYGLYDGAELIAVATFGKSRFKAKAEYEWVRYAVKQNHIIHGGPNKLWKTFVAEVTPPSVISYIDFDHTTAVNVFLSQCGFTEQDPTGPSLVWSKKTERIYNNSLLALGADRLLKTSYGSREKSGLDNNDIMLLEGWLPVYTAGNRVFNWTQP